MSVVPHAAVLRRWSEVVVRARSRRMTHVRLSALVLTLFVVVAGFLMLYPPLLLLVESFNTAKLMFVDPAKWGLDNWRAAFQNPLIFRSLFNTVMIWGLSVGISLPVAVGVAWALARTRVPFSRTMEFFFWLSFMIPGIANTVAWITVLDKHVGVLNKALEALQFVHQGPFNTYSIGGIVWVHLMTNGIGVMVMLLTPAFRNMDATLEEAAVLSGASKARTALRVMLPLMASPIVLVFALQLIRVFQSFEIEQLLGTPFHFFVYSTLIYQLVERDLPLYGQATALAALTLGVVALIVPLQRWIITRRQYTTITGRYKPGLVDIGKWQIVVNLGIMGLLVILVGVPVVSLALTTLMTRAGYFQIQPTFTLDHWRTVLSDVKFLDALRTTFELAGITALISPLLFSFFAYIIVRTRWLGRQMLDSTIWISAAIPGILSSLGLLSMFLNTPFLRFLYPGLFAMVLAVVFQGHTTGTNVMKGVFLQVGQEMEDAARTSGAGWVRTYFKIWLPLMMPTLILIGTLHFVIAAGTTSHIVLLASRDTTTLSLLALQYSSPDIALWEEASVVSLIIIGMTLGVALIARTFGLRLSLQHR